MGLGSRKVCPCPGTRRSPTPTLQCQSYTNQPSASGRGIRLPLLGACHKKGVTITPGETSQPTASCQGTLRNVSTTTDTVNSAVQMLKLTFSYN